MWEIYHGDGSTKDQRHHNWRHLPRKGRRWIKEVLETLEVTLQWFGIGIIHVWIYYQYCKTWYHDKNGSGVKIQGVAFVK